ncbi:glycosyltransferase involved in cell wall biosynthesis [Chitinophaga sp. W2I13]|uniref:glycosyltransferase n=2 Tax=unclassified Chitinophaga TaxID=2619133 RepID=UPI003D22EBEC
MKWKIPESNMKGVSVIICCYNSASRLPQTLAHLNEQVVPEDFSWEIILVNNASTDNTVEYTSTVWKENKPANATCRVVEELTRGQMYARKRGAREANYECLIFCDDDNLLDKNYVYLSWQVMLKDKKIGAAGGQNVPVTNSAAYPDWFEEYKDKYAIGIPAEESGDVTHRGFVLGAGLITRRALFLQVFDDRYPSLLNGRNGEKLTTGDDFEYCKRLLLWGFTLYYDKDLKLKHFIPAERLTIDYRDRLMDGIREATKVLSVYDRALFLHNKNKHKNRWRLLAITPFRILLARIGLSKRDLTTERQVLFYLSPFAREQDEVTSSIKKFLNNK